MIAMEYTDIISRITTTAIATAPILFTNSVNVGSPVKVGVIETRAVVHMITKDELKTILINPVATAKAGLNDGCFAADPSVATPSLSSTLDRASALRIRYCRKRCKFVSGDSLGENV
jgi:hypothetical protein